MVCQKVKIKNPAGLHLRPAGKLCDEAIKYRAKISFQKGNATTNAKSLLSVLAQVSSTMMRWKLSVKARMKRKHWKELWL